MTDINATLAARGSRYGSFEDNANASQRIKCLLKDIATEQETPLTMLHAEALDNFAQKLSRILCGDPNYTDNWHDIAGYATLVENQLIEQEPKRKR